jgi:tRNA threonylcarbamoyladenosine biosynthesis protein TsaE
MLLVAQVKRYNQGVMEHMVDSLDETMRLAVWLGGQLRGGEVLELVGDVGSGKTTFTKGLARGLGVDDDVQSPSFTISRVYVARDGLELHHYDLYRLAEPGIMQYDIAESVQYPKVVTVIEWGETVSGLLPKNRIRLDFHSGELETERRIVLHTEDTKLEEAYATWH